MKAILVAFPTLNSLYAVCSPFFLPSRDGFCLLLLCYTSQLLSSLRLPEAVEVTLLLSFRFPFTWEGSSSFELLVTAL